MNISNGNTNWKFRTSAHITASPVFKGSTIYIGSGNGYLYALDAKTGAQKWKIETALVTSAGRFPQECTPVIVGDLIICGGYITKAFRAETGIEQWSYESKGKSLVANSFDGTLYLFSLYAPPSTDIAALDANSGRMIWTAKIEGQMSSPPNIQAGNLLFGTSGGQLVAVDKGVGNLIWKFKTGGMITSRPMSIGQTIFVVSQDGYIYAVE